MNIALEQTREVVRGKERRNYGDAFVRGNNGMAFDGMIRMHFTTRTDDYMQSCTFPPMPDERARHPYLVWSVEAKRKPVIMSASRRSGARRRNTVPTRLSEEPGIGKLDCDSDEARSQYSLGSSTS